MTPQLEGSPKLLVDRLVIRAAVAVAILASICAAAAVPAMMGAPSGYRVGKIGSEGDKVPTTVDDDDDDLLFLDVGKWLLPVVVMAGEEIIRAASAPSSSPSGGECGKVVRSGLGT